MVHNKNRLRAQDVHQIVDTFNKQQQVDKYSKMVTYSEIEENEYNLNIPRYIDSSREEDIQDLYAHLNGGIPNRDIANLKEYWDVFQTLKDELFELSAKDDYSAVKVESSEVKSFILGHNEFNSFRDEVFAFYRSWDHFEELYNLDTGFKPKELIASLGEDLLEKFKDVKLISKYDIYQILMDYWAETMQDDCYMISIDGWEVGSKVRELIPSKDKKGNNVYKEAHDFEFNKVRYVADLIPPQLLVGKYFQAEQIVIDELQSKLDSASSELETYIEENSGEDGLLEDAKTDKGSITKTSISNRLKIAVDTDEIEVLKNCKKLIEDEAKVKKDLKKASDELSLIVFKKYPTLSTEDIKFIVIEDKWLKHIVTQIDDEINRVTTSLANRIKDLEERYKEPLKTIESNVNILSSKIEEHLKAMGLSW